MRTGLISIAVFGLILAGPARAQDPEKPAAPSQDEFDQLVEQLGHEDFDTREAAQKKLEAFGKAALPMVKEAQAKTQDLERRTRLAEIAKRLDPPAAKPAEKNPNPAEEWSGAMREFKIERPDPKKQLEEMGKLLEQMKKTLENKDLTDEEKVREMTRLSAQLQSAAYRGAAGNVIRVQRIGRVKEVPPAPAPERIPSEDKPKEKKPAEDQEKKEEPKKPREYD